MLCLAQPSHPRNPFLTPSTAMVMSEHDKIATVGLPCPTASLPDGLLAIKTAMSCPSPLHASTSLPCDAQSDTSEEMDVETPCSSTCGAPTHSSERYCFPDEGWTPSYPTSYARYTRDSMRWTTSYSHQQTYTHFQSKCGPWTTATYSTTCGGDWSSGEESTTEQGIPEIIGCDSGVYYM